MVAAFVSCSSGDDSGSTPPVNSQEVITAVQSGTWRIVNFVDSTIDETNKFDGYNFTFLNDGTVTAVKGAITINGTWSVVEDDSSNTVDFNIFFASPPEFAELSEDWDIISRTNSQIQLLNNSGGNGDTDFLTFQKN